MKTTNWPFSIFNFWFSNLLFFNFMPVLETKIDDWDFKLVIFNSWGIKHWKSRLGIFDFQLSIWNKNQMAENHTDPCRPLFQIIIGSPAHIFSRSINKCFSFLSFCLSNVGVADIGFGWTIKLPLRCLH